jgi:hypothetical protein
MRGSLDWGLQRCDVREQGVAGVECCSKSSVMLAEQLQWEARGGESGSGKLTD